MKQMAPDTKDEMLRINLKMMLGVLALIGSFGTGIAWGVRLEYRTEENDRANNRQDIAIKQLEADRAIQRESQVRLESDMKHLVNGVDEIKTLIKQVHKP